MPAGAQSTMFMRWTRQGVEPSATTGAGGAEEEEEEEEEEEDAPFFFVEDCLARFREEVAEEAAEEEVEEEEKEEVEEAEAAEAAGDAAAFALPLEVDLVAALALDALGVALAADGEALGADFLPFLPGVLAEAAFLGGIVKE